MKDHLFVSSTDGALYDTRVPAWSSMPALRPNFSIGHRQIDTMADFKACLRHGGFAWPGGYPMFFVMADGGALSFKTARKEIRAIAGAFANPMRGDGWRPVAFEINYEDGELFDDHTGERIESAYAEPEEEEGA